MADYYACKRIQVRSPCDSGRSDIHSRLPKSKVRLFIPNISALRSNAPLCRLCGMESPSGEDK